MLINSSDNLIICLTPLQMLIAEKIIEKNSDKTFDLLVISLFDNDKYKYYYSKLENKVRNANYFVYKPAGFYKNLKNFFDFKKFYKKNFNNKVYSGYYLASIDSRHCQYILSLCENFKLYTFDDGTANIFADSLYFVDRKTSFIKKIFLNMNGIRKHSNDLKDMSLKHYTIYDGISNAFSRLEFISLFSYNIGENNTQENSKIRIFLGQPFSEYSKDLNYEFINKLILNLDIDLYFPHPREGSLDKSILIVPEIVKTDLILEDYIVEILKNNCNVDLYSFASSGAINCACLPGVNISFIYNEFVNQSNVNIYESLRGMGYPILSVDSIK